MKKRIIAARQKLARLWHDPAWQISRERAEIYDTVFCCALGLALLIYAVIIVAHLFFPVITG